MESRSVKIGIIGGSGMENPDIMQNTRVFSVSTPFGAPSDQLVEEVDVIIATTACGSLQQEIAPGDLVFPTSIFDSKSFRTHKRQQTFFDGQPGHPEGVIHLPSEPILMGCAKELGYKYHDGGFGVCIEGPRYSTKAESIVYKSWGASLVSMTLIPEGLLAKELGIPYANVTLVTDYDCWKSEEHVSMEGVMETFAQNVHKAISLFKLAVTKIAKHDWTKEIKEAKELARSSVMVDKSVVIPHLQC